MQPRASRASITTTMAASSPCRLLCCTRLISRTNNRHINSSIFSLSFQPPLSLARAFTVVSDTSDERGRSNNDDDEPRIQLSRQQIQQLWEDLGKDDSHVIRPEQHLKDPFGDASDASPAISAVPTTDRITIDPNDFPLDLFDPQPTLHSTDQYDDKNQVLVQVDKLDSTEQRAAFEAEIAWHLKRATRVDVDPHRLVEQAHHILERWHEKAQDNCDLYPTPSWYAHDSVLRGWKRIGMWSPDFQSAQRADDALQLLLNLVDTEKLEVEASLDKLFAWVIRLWLRASYSFHSESHDPDDLPRLLECATRALELLLNQEKRSEILNNDSFCKRPERAFYSDILNLFNRVSMAASKIRPEKSSTDENGSALAKIAAQRSERLLTRMEELTEIPDIDFLPPDAYAYRAVLSSWANVQSEEGIGKANAVLRRMEEIAQRNAKDVNNRRILLHTYAILSPLEDYDATDPTLSANKAISVLTRMDPELASQTNDAMYMVAQGENTEAFDAEDIVCYGAVIEALAQAKVNKSETSLDVTPATLAAIILNRVDDLSSNRKLSQPPNAKIYGNVIQAYSRWATRTADKSTLAQRVERVLQLLEKSVLQNEQLSADLQQNITKWHKEAIEIISEPSFGGSPARGAELKERMESVLRQSVVK